MALSGKATFIVRSVYAASGIFIGLSVFVVFGFHYRNWNAALWGLLSGLTASLTLFVHIGYQQQRWESCPKCMKVFMLCGCFIQLAGVCGLATYLTLAITLKQGLIIPGNGYYLTVVWCFITWKWGFILFYVSRRYMREMESKYKPLVGSKEEAAEINS